MTDIACPVTPFGVTYSITANVGQFTSETTGYTQFVAYSGDRWTFDLVWDNLDDNNRRDIQAWLWRLVTQENRALISPYGHANRGAYGGTPLIAGASQTGTSINIDGASLSVTNWARAGDFVQIGTQLHMVLANANSNGSGAVTLSLRPSVRVAPADNAAVDVTTPEGRFYLASPEVSWDARPSMGGGLSSFSARFVEDVA